MADRDGLTLGASFGMEGLNSYWRSSIVFRQLAEVGAQLLWEVEQDPYRKLRARAPTASAGCSYSCHVCSGVELFTSRVYGGGCSWSSTICVTPTLASLGSSLFSPALTWGLCNY